MGPAWATAVPEQLLLLAMLMVHQSLACVLCSEQVCILCMACMLCIVGFVHV